MLAPSSHSRSLALDQFVCPRTGEAMLLSTVAFAEPVSYGNPEAPELSYVAETILWTLDSESSLNRLAAGPIRYRRLDSIGWYVGAVESHRRILSRAQRRGRGRDRRRPRGARHARRAIRVSS